MSNWVMMIGTVSILLLRSGLTDGISQDLTQSFIPSYTVHGLITITSDSDFSSQSWPGSGTSEDPYRIESLAIESPSGSHCIEIRNTRSHFLVNDCLLTHAGDYAGGTHANAGVLLENTTNGRILNMMISDTGPGIFLKHSNDTIIEDNTCIGGVDDGVLVRDSFNILVQRNNCSNNGAWGVSAYAHDTDEVYGILIANNTCFNNSIGIIVSHCSSGVVVNNTCLNNSIGIDMSTCTDIEIRNTTCVNQDGISLRETSLVTVTNNTVLADGDFSISLVECEDISVTWNSFTNNDGHVAIDDAGLSLFDYNYYSDYSGEDKNGDGIGDTPYIHLYGNIWDSHPLMSPPPLVPQGTTGTTTTTTTTTMSSPTTTPLSDTGPDFSFTVTIVALTSAGWIVALILVIKRRTQLANDAA